MERKELEEIQKELIIINRILLSKSINLFTIFSIVCFLHFHIKEPISIYLLLSLLLPSVSYLISATQEACLRVKETNLLKLILAQDRSAADNVFS